MSGQLALELASHFGHQVGYRAGAGEIRSWEHSLPVLAADLIDAGLDDVEVLVEYRLPLSSKRIDAILAGTHPRTGLPNFVVVELKQWSAAELVSDETELVHVDAYGTRPVLHPVEQVRRYCTFLRDFTRAFSGQDVFHGVAYLHNASDAAVAELCDLNPDSGERLFTRTRRGEWLDHLRGQLAPSSGAASADQLETSAIAPSQQLLSLAAAEVRDRQQFVLLDEQQVAFRLVERALRRARDANQKTAVVIDGGPGSGKSVIALSLLGELSRQGRTVLHATGSAAFTQTMRRVAGHRSSSVKALFRYFNQFAAVERNSIDVLICDEAHRIRATSANRFTAKANRSTRRQVDELLAAARVPVFLLDEHQVVRPGEVGRRALIEEAAHDAGIEVESVDLNGQFRSGGSRAYEIWVLRLLGLEPGGPVSWEGDDRFVLEVADGPGELEQRLAAEQSSVYTARMTAGFCWPWSNDRDGHLVDDVRIGNWHRPWNNKSDRRLNGAPPSDLWASENGGFGQVGCIYTAQGFEYDWNGVIFGPDLVWRDGRFVSDVRESKDPAFRGGGAAEFDTNVRNVYKVLLTRGMVGTLVTSTDPETRDIFRQLVKSPARIAQPAKRYSPTQQSRYRLDAPPAV